MQRLEEVDAYEQASGAGGREEGDGEGGEVEWRGLPLSRLGLRYFTPREVGGMGGLGGQELSRGNYLTSFFSLFHFRSR